MSDLDVKAILDMRPDDLRLKSLVPDLCAEVERLRSEARDKKNAWAGLLSSRDEALAASAEALRVEKLRHEGTMHVLLRKEAELKQARDWEDIEDEWSAAISDAFPTKSDSHDEYGVAMQMVGHRHSKGELVALVNWLLVRLRVQDEQLVKVQETWSAVEVDNERLRAALRRSVPSCGCMGCVVAKQDVDKALGIVLPEAAQPDLMGKALAPTPTGGKEHE